MDGGSLISAGSALVGALVGAAVTYFVQRAATAWDRQRWNLEQKKLEYREMLSASAALDWALQTQSTSLGQPELRRVARKDLGLTGGSETEKF